MSNRTFMHYGWIIIALVVLTAILFTATPFTQLVFNTAQKPVEDIGNQLDTCSHLHTKQESSYTRQDNDRHEVISKTVCEDCGKTLSEYSLGVYENHVYDENYVCTLCGYIHQHAHTTLITSKYKDFDETRHIYVSSYACNCGHVIDYVNFIGEHEYPADGNICSLCGHVKAKPSQTINIDNVSFIMRYGTGTRSSFVSASDGGTLHVTSSNPSCVQATIEDGVITFEVLKPSDTPVTVTITADATSNYGPGSLDVTVFAQKGTQKIVPSSGGMSIRITNTKPFSAAAEGTGVASPSVITLNTLVGGVESNSIARYTGTNGQLSISGDLYGAAEGLAYVHLSLSENDYYEAAEMYIPITVSSLMEQTISVSNNSGFSDSVTSVVKTYNDPNFTLYAKTNGDGALSVTSSNTNVIAASISGGTITLDVKNAGSSTITVSAAQTLTYASSTYTVTITVQKQTPAVTFNDISMTYGEAAKTATYTVTTGTSSELSVVYKTTNNTNVAVSSNFTVTALKAGTSVITYTISGNGANAGNYNTIESTCTVTIAKATQTVNASNVSIIVDGQKDIGATVTGNGTATKGTLTYVSADTDKLTVDESGKLTAHKGVAGSDSTTVKVTIYAAENDWYNAASKEITVTITKKTPTITLSKDALNLLYNGATGVITYSTNGPALPVANVTTSNKAVAYLVASAHSTTAFTVSPNHIQVNGSVNTYQTTEGGGAAYEGGVGTATITLTFPTNEYWLGATRTVAVTVTKGTPVLTINSTDSSALGNVPFGTDKNLRYSWIGDNNLSVTSSNSSVLTVSPAANWNRNQTVTIHPVAPGTATVDFTAAEGTHFTALSKQSVTVTVTKGTQTLVPSVTSWSTSYSNTKTFDLSSSTKSGTADFGAVTYKMGSQAYVTSGTSSDSVASISYNSSTGVFTLTTIKPGTTKAYLYYAATSHYNASDVVEIEITVAKGTQTTNTSINSWNTAYSGSTTLNLSSSTKSGSQPFGVVKYKIGSQSYVTSGTSADTVASVSYNSSTGVFTLTSLKPGTTVFYVYHDATDYYNASTVKTLTITITKGTQTMASDTTSWNVPYGSTKSVSIAGSTKSGSHAYGAVTYKIGSNSYISNGSSSDAVASISYNTSTGKFELSTVKPGTTKAYIKYASSEWYNESNVVEISITVTKGSQSISSVSNLGNVKYGTNPATAITLTKSGSADFGTISATSSLPEAATVALSGSGNSRTSTVTTVKPNDGTVTITISIAGNDYYEAATNVTYTLKVIKGDQTLSMSDAAIAFTSTGSAWSPATATRAVTLTKSGTASYGALTAVSSSNAVATASLSGSGDSRTLTVTPVAAGTCDVTVSLAGNDYYNASTPASIKITNVSVTKKTQTLTSDKTSVSITYNGTATVTIGGNSTGLRYIMSNSSTAPAESSFVSSGATSTTTAQASAPVSGTFTITSLKPGTTYLYVYAPENTYNNRSTNTVKVTITVSKGSQTIELDDASNITFASNGTTFTPSASVTKVATLTKSGSADYGTFSASSSDSAIASVSVSGSGNNRDVTINAGTKAGTATITVSLAGTDWYNAATSKTFTVTLTKKAQTITTDKTSSGVSLVHKNSNTITVSGSNSTITATSSDTSIATVSVSGNVVTVNAASYPSTLGSCTISIYAQENTYYQKSNTVNVTATVGKGTQEITLSSGGQMTFSASGGAWSPATDSRDFTIYKSGDAPYGSLTATSSNTSVATVALSGSGNNRTVTVTPKASGSSTITIALGGTDYYSAATSKTFTVVVNKQNQTWTLSSTSVTQTYNPSTAPTTNVTISGTTYGTVQYKVAGQSYVTSGESKDSTVSVTKSGSNYVITGLKAGTTTVYIKATGNDYYNERELTVTVTVNKAASSISTTAASATYGNGATSTPISKVGDGSLTLDTSTLDTNIATVTLSGGNLVVTPVKPGNTSVKLSISAGDNYAAAGPITVSITINKNTQTISSLTLGSSSISVGGTTTVTASYSHGGSGTAPCGTLSFTSSNTGVATLSGSGDSRTVTGVAKGSSTITATLAATEYYTAATKTVTVSVKTVTNFSLSKTAISVNYGAANQTVTVSDLTSGYDGTLTVSTNNSNVATASISGNVITIDPGYVGTATITVNAPATSGYTAQTHTISVTVNPLQRTLTADKTNVSLTNVNETVTVTINTNNFGTLTATSASTSIATCSLSGSNGDATRTLTIKLVSVGTTSITVTAQAYNAGGSSDNEYTAKTIVILVKKGSALSVTPSSKSIKVGDTSTATVSALNGYPLSSVTISGYNSSIIDNVSYNTSTGVISFRGKSIGTTTITISGPAVGDFAAPIATTLTIEVTNAQSSQTVSLSPTSLSLTRGYVYTGQTNSTWSHTGYGSYNSASTTLGGTYVGTITWRVGTSNAWTTGNGSQTDGNITVTRSGNTFTATTSDDGSTTLYVYAAATTSGMVDYTVSNTATCTISASHATSKDVYNKGIVSQSPTLTPGSINLTRGWIYSTALGTASWSLNGYNTSYGQDQTVLGGTYYGSVSWRVGTTNSWLTNNGSQKGTYVTITRTGTTFVATADSPNNASSDGTSETLYVKISEYSTDYVVYQETTVTCTVSLSHDENEDQKLKSSQVIWWNSAKTDNAAKNITLTTSSSSVTYTIYDKGSVTGTYSALQLEASSTNTGVATVSVNKTNGTITITRVANGSAQIKIYAKSSVFLSKSNELVVNVTCSNAGASQSPTLTPTSLSLTRGWSYTGTTSSTWFLTRYDLPYNSASTVLGGTYGGTVYWRVGTSNEWTTENGSQTDGYITVTRSGNTFTASATSPNSSASDGTSTTLYVKVGSYTNLGIDYSEATVTCTISLSHDSGKDEHNKGSGTQNPILTPASISLSRTVTNVGTIAGGRTPNYGSYNSNSTSLGGTYGGAVSWKLGSNSYTTGNGPQSESNISVSKSGTTFTATASGDGTTTLYVKVAAYSTDYVNYAEKVITCTITASSNNVNQNGTQSISWSTGGTSSKNATLTTAAPSTTYTIVTGGTTYRTSLLRATSANTGIATASVSGNVVTITKVANGSTTVTIQAIAGDYLDASNTLTVSVSCVNSGASQSPTFTPSSLSLTNGWIYAGQSSNTWSKTGETAYNSASTTLGGTYGGAVTWRLYKSDSNKTDWKSNDVSLSLDNITVTKSGVTFTATASGNGSVTLQVNVAAYSAGGIDYTAASATCTISSTHATSKDVYNPGSGTQNPTLTPNSLSLTRGFIYTGQLNHTWSSSPTGYTAYNSASTTLGGTYYGSVSWKLGSNGYTTGDGQQTSGNITVTRSGNTFTAQTTGDGSATLYVKVGQHVLSKEKVTGGDPITCYTYAEKEITCTITASHDTDKDVNSKGNQSIWWNSANTDQTSKNATLTTAAPTVSYNIYTLGTTYRGALLGATSSNTGVATVSVNTSTGVVTITKVANGSATVTIQASASTYLNASNVLTVSVTCVNSGASQNPSLTPSETPTITYGDIYEGQSDNTWLKVGSTSYATSTYKTLTITLGGTYGGAVTWKLGSNSYTSSTSGSQTASNITATRSGATFTITATGDGSTTLYVNVAAYSSGGIDYTAATATCTITATNATSKDVYNPGYGNQSLTLTPTSLSLTRGRNYVGNIATNDWTLSSYGAYNSGTTVLGGTYGGTISWKVGSNSWITTSNSNQAENGINVKRESNGTTFTATASANGTTTLYAKVAGYSTSAAKLDGSGNATCYIWAEVSSENAATCTITSSNAAGKDTYTKTTQRIYFNSGNTDQSAKNATLTTASPTATYTIYTRNSTYYGTLLTATSSNTGVATVSVNTSTGVVTITRVANGSATISIQAIDSTPLNASNILTVNVTCSSSAASQTPTLTPNSLSLTNGWTYVGVNASTNGGAWSKTGETAYNSDSTTLGGTYYGTVSWKLGSNSYTTGNGPQTSGNITVTRSGTTFTATATGDGSATLTVKVGAYESGNYSYAETTVSCTITASHDTGKDSYNKGSQTPSVSPTSIGLTNGWRYTGQSNNTWSKTGETSYNTSSATVSTFGTTYSGALYWVLSSSSTAPGSGYVNNDTKQTVNNISVTRDGSTFNVSASGNGTAYLYIYANSTTYLNASGKLKVTITSSHDTSKDVYNPGSGNQTITLTPSSLTVKPGNTATTTIGGTYGGTITVTCTPTSIATASRSGTTITVTGVATGSATVTASVAAYSTSAAKLDGSGNATCYNWGTASATCSVTVSNSSGVQSPTPTPSSLTLTRGYIYTGQSNNTWSHTGYGSYNSASTVLGGTYGGTVSWKLGSNSYTTGNGPQTSGNITVTRSGTTFTATATSTSSSDGTSATLYVKVGAYTSGTVDYAEAVVTCTISLSHATSKDDYNPGYGNQTITLTPNTIGLVRTLTYTGQPDNTWLLTSDTGFGSSTTTIGGTYGGTISVTSSATSVATASRSGTTVTVTGVANGSATVTASVAAYSTSAAKLDGSGNATCYNWGSASATCTVTVSTVYIHNAGSGDQTITLTPNALTVRPSNTATTTIGGTHGGTITVTSSATGKATVSRSGNTITVTGVATGSATVTASVAAYSTTAAKMDGSGNATCYNWGAAEATCAVTVSNSLVSQTITSDKSSVSLTRTVYRTGTVNNTWAVTSYGSYNSNTVTISGAKGTLNWILSSATSAPASGYVTTTTAQTVNGITVSRSGSVFTITAASNGTAYLYVYADAATVGTTDYPKSNTLKITITSSNGANSDSKGSQSITWSDGTTTAKNLDLIYSGSTTIGQMWNVITVDTTYRGDLLTATSSNAGVVDISVNTSTGYISATPVGVGTTTITIQATGNTYLNASNTLTMNVTSSYNEYSQSFSFNSSYGLDIYRTGTFSHTWTVNGSDSIDVSNPYIRGTIHWILSSSTSAPASGYVTTDTSMTVNNITVSKDGNTFTLAAGSTSGTAYLYVYADETVSGAPAGGIAHYAATSTQKVTITSSYSDTKGSQSIYFNSGRTDQAAKSNSFNVGNGTTYTIYTAGTSYRGALLTATSSNSSVASVSVNTSQGKVTINGVAAGSATITIKANSSTYLNASNTLTVNITVNAALIERPYSWTSNSFTGTIYEATKGVKATYTFHTLGTGAVTWSGTFTSNPTGTRSKDTSLVDGEATYTFTGSASNNNGSTFTLTCTVAADSTYKSVSGSITITYRTTPKPSVEIPDVILYQGCGVPLQFGGAKAPGSGVNITLSGVGSGNIPNVIVRYITWTSTPEYNGWYLIGLKEGEFTFSVSIPAYTSGGKSYSAATRTVSAKVEVTVAGLEGSHMGGMVVGPGDMVADYEPWLNNNDTLNRIKTFIAQCLSGVSCNWIDGGGYSVSCSYTTSSSLTINDIACPVCGTNYSGTALSTEYIETFCPGTRVYRISSAYGDSLTAGYNAAVQQYMEGDPLSGAPVRIFSVPSIYFYCPTHGGYNTFYPVTNISIGVPCEPYWLTE